MTDTTPTHAMHLMRSDPDWTLLARFLREEASDEERAAIVQWESADPANAELLALMRCAWVEAAVDGPDADEDAGWLALHARIAAARPVTPRPLRVLPGPVRSTRQRWMRFIAAAAAVLAVVAGSFLWWRTHPTAPVQPAREYATTRGQRAELLLVDGTRVWLSVDSRLRVPEGYGKDARDVELQGEAYFVVEHDAERPFRVHARGAVSEVLGTEFGVRAYADDADVAVAVASGRVAVRGERASERGTHDAELTRGQMARIDSVGRVTVTDSVDLAALFDWRAGRLRFEERPLTEVVEELERWYDLDIVLDDSVLASVPVTTSLGRRNADQALAILAGVLDARYERDGRRVRLAAKAAGR